MIPFNQPLKTLQPWVELLPQGLFDLEIKNISFDSREVKTGDLFVALPSVAGNELQYVQVAIDNGASVVLAEKSICEQVLSDGASCVAVHNIMDVAGSILAFVLNGQALDLSVVGITGTNGKSSISFYLAQLLNALHKPCAVMGTVGYGKWDDLKPSGMTTLPLEKLHCVLNELSVDFSAVAMEVSSHGLEQNRLAGVKFEGAVFSNLSRDHLDYHGTMEAYGAAKALLFQRAELKFAVMNGDDPFTQTLKALSVVTPLIYGQGNEADLRFSLDQMHDAGMTVTFHWKGQSHSVNLPLFGQFNAENVAAAMLCCLQMGHAFSSVVQACAALNAVPGRMQQVKVSEKQPLVLVDYAHTPDALEQILLATKQHASGKITLVVGCGGDRDAGKRPLMGKIALQFADNAIITSDNPRSENPLSICQQMVDGMQGNFVIEVDRQKAIQQAITQANPTDIVIIAGKGHEDYQEIQGQRRYFSDVVEAEQALLLGDHS